MNKVKLALSVLALSGSLATCCVAEEVSCGTKCTEATKCCQAEEAKCPCDEECPCDEKTQCCQEDEKSASCEDKAAE